MAADSKGSPDRIQSIADQQAIADQQTAPDQRDHGFGGVGLPGLTVVATPIGNLGDITYRGVACLKAADLVACEDTRLTRRLLDRYRIDTPLIPYHDHNAAQILPRLIDRMTAGASLCLVSDAGTPLISDPGYRLVAACREAAIPVTAAPGPSALTAALSIAGLPTDRFLFAGFLPAKQGARRKALAELLPTPASLVLYEAPQRLKATLDDIAAIEGGRDAAICRELTKRYEEIRRGTIAELAAGLGDTPKGEIVLVIGPPTQARPQLSEAEIDARLRELIAEDGVNQSAAQLARDTGLSKRDLYRRAQRLKDAQ